jgi:hypothetical protein
MITFSARAKAFSGQRVQAHKFALEGNTVRVWDTIAGHYTSCHALSPSTQRRLVKLGIEQNERIENEQLSAIDAIAENE